MIAGTITIEPGVYPGMSFDEYRRIDALNSSTLLWGLHSMRHLKAAIDRRLEREDTEALAMGRALHVRLLEPDRYADAVHVKAPCEVELKSGDRKGMSCGLSSAGYTADGVWACRKHGGDESSLLAGHEYITQAEADAIERISEALREHSAEKMRRARGEYEVVIVGELAGRRFKARLDKWIASPATIVDVKKVAAPTSPDRVGITPRSFANRIASYGYGMAAAIYCDLAMQAFGLTELPRWYWLAVEDGEPFTVQAYRASEKCITAGRTEYMLILDQMKRCEESGVWPSGDDVEHIDGPDWWLAKNGQQ